MTATAAKLLTALRAEHARLAAELRSDASCLGRSALAKVADEIVALELAEAKREKAAASGKVAP